MTEEAEGEEGEEESFSLLHFSSRPSFSFSNKGDTSANAYLHPNGCVNQFIINVWNENKSRSSALHLSSTGQQTRRDEVQKNVETSNAPDGAVTWFSMRKKSYPLDHG